ncbi:putative MFS-type transporter YfcJ [Gammaproteobacteria bacterium]|nr:putative MFS-type transporter YfcJ [Gammaproteobacteria bacterium]
MADRRERLLTIPFAIASAVNFLQGMALHAYLHLPGWLDELGADELVNGLIFGLMSGAAIAVRPLAGRVMDGAGRRVVILAGGVLQVLACGLYLTVGSIGAWLVVVRALQGFAEGALFSSLFTYAADIVPASRRTEGIGLFGVSGMAPIALGGLMGDLVLAHWHYRELFLVSLAIASLALVASLPLREPARARGSMAPSRGFWSALRQTDLMPIWMIGSATAVALAALLAFVKTFVDELHVGSVGLFFSAYAAAAIVLRLGFGWVPDRIGKKTSLYPALVCVSVALVVLSGARGDVEMGVAGAFAGLGHGFAFPILSALVVDRANPADRGSAISLYTAVFDAGILLGAPIHGALARAADLRTMFFAAAFVPIAGAIAFHVWDRAALRAAVPETS